MNADIVLRTVWVALGANLGDPVGMLRSTVSELDSLRAPGSPALAASGLYRTAPIDAEGPDYFNAVVRFVTLLSPTDLLRQCQALENAAGRHRSYVNAPRPLDIDILLVDSLQTDTPELTLPHPRMHLRAFVLRPMLDLGADNLTIPGRGTVSGCEVLTRDQRIERMPSPWVPQEISG